MDERCTAEAPNYRPLNLLELWVNASRQRALKTQMRSVKPGQHEFPNVPRNPEQ